VAIKEEYERLMLLIEDSADKVDLEKILKQAVDFFEQVRAVYPTASKEDREELIHMMTSLKTRLEEVSQKAAENAGMSQDELMALSEDPSNFTPEQWRLVQDTKRQMYDSARKFSASVDQQKRKKGTPPAPREKKPLRTPTRRRSRKDWMKS